jgi:hypothetical protein
MSVTGPKNGTSVVSFVQQKQSPIRGTILYATRMSLFTGAGSQRHAVIQEAGLLILGGLDTITEFNATSVGVAYDRSRLETPGWVRYRVGNRRDGDRTQVDISDTQLPFKITEGEWVIWGASFSSVPWRAAGACASRLVLHHSEVDG